MQAFVALDPGNTHTAFVVWTPGSRVLDYGYLTNDELLLKIDKSRLPLVIEMIASYGMAVGAEVFQTCVWIGRFMQAAINRGVKVDLMFRRTVKLHLCGVSNAKDSNIRMALLDLFGPGKLKAQGTKKAPGPLYGVSGDVWAALGVAVTHAHQLAQIPHHP